MKRENNIALFDTMLSEALALPDVKVERDVFLRKVLVRYALIKYCTSEDIERAIEHTPIQVLSHEQLDEIVSAIIKRNALSLKSTVSGRNSQPLGILFGGGREDSIDMVSRISVYLKTAQHIAYLNGYPDLRNQAGGLDDYAIAILIPMVGVLFDAPMAIEAVHGITKRAVEDIAQQTIRTPSSRIYSYGSVKEIANWIGAHTTYRDKHRDLLHYLLNIYSVRCCLILPEMGFERAAEKLAETLKNSRQCFLR